MAKVAMGKVVKVELGFTHTDKGKKTHQEFSIGSVLEFDTVTRTVGIKEKVVKADAKTATVGTGLSPDGGDGASGDGI
jgi:hypothetical protein